MRHSHSYRRRSTSISRLESASVLITYSPLDAFEAMSEGAALMHSDGLAASLHTCAHHCGLLNVTWSCCAYLEGMQAC